MTNKERAGRLRKEAADLLNVAKTLRSEAIKAEYIQLAVEYERLASEAEKLPDV